MNNINEIQVRVYDEIITLTQQTIIKTRESQIKNCHGCIAEVESGKVYLNPEYGFDRYKAEKLKEIEQIKDGKYDHYFGFIQKAVYIQTKESVPMFAK